MKFFKLLMSLQTVFFMSGCSLIERSPQSGYDSRTSKLRSNPQQSLSPAPQNPSPVNLKSQLKMLESSLSTNREIEQYSKLLPLFTSDQEKITFLQNGDFESKQAWIRESQILSRNQALQASMQTLIENRDIALKMPANLVIKSWGEPDTIEVSGNPKFKNERWTYRRMVPQTDGFKKEIRTVYIESGVVAGWEVE